MFCSKRQLQSVAPGSRAGNVLTAPLARPWKTQMNRTNLVAAMLAMVLLTTAAPVVRSADGAGSKPVTRLITLGTQGGPRGSADRSQPSSVLIVNGKPYL